VPIGDSLRDSLGAFRSAFRDEYAALRAGGGGAAGGDVLGAYAQGRAGADTLDAYGASRTAAYDPLAAYGQARGATDTAQATGFGILGGYRQQGGDAFSLYGQARRLAATHAQDREQAELAAQVRAQGTLAAGDWSGPATADDNTTLDAGKIDQWIVATRPNSPLRGMGGYILQQANAAGVSVPLLMGILLKESELGTTAGPGFNIAGVGGEGNFAQYGSWQQALDGAIRNLAGPLYKGKSAEEQVGNWFVGPQAWASGGLSATDSTGGRNGNVGQYLNGPVAAAYGGLGVPFNQGAAGTRRAGGGATGSLGAITGGQGAIMQEFGSTDYAEANPDVYSFATAMGLRAGQHSGIDIGLTRGTPLYSPVAGTVTIAGNSGFYKDSGGGPGELRIRLDNGDELILGHDSAINVRVGQRVTPGMLVGLSGGSDGDHVHVEYRIRDSSTPSGWRIVDPRSRLGGGVAVVSGPTTRPATTGRPIRY
jgi:murein DD-endopeptidase MepM/ murein hydrolase activator NlpD